MHWHQRLQRRVELALQSFQVASEAQQAWQQVLCFRWRHRPVLQAVGCPVQACYLQLSQGQRKQGQLKVQEQRQP